MNFKYVPLIFLISTFACALGAEHGYSYPDQEKANREIQKTGHVGTATWCTVETHDKIIVECNYNTKDECENYRQEDEMCKPNPDNE